VQDFSVLVLDDIKGYRILFDWYPTSDSVDPVELRLFIRTNDRTLSETWLYQYFPPAPDKRKYPEGCLASDRASSLASQLPQVRCRTQIS
jgi:hypothetical protein